MRRWARYTFNAAAGSSLVPFVSLVVAWVATRDAAWVVGCYGGRGSVTLIVSERTVAVHATILRGQRAERTTWGCYVTPRPWRWYGDLPRPNYRWRTRAAEYERWAASTDDGSNGFVERHLTVPDWAVAPALIPLPLAWVHGYRRRRRARAARGFQVEPATGAGPARG